MERTKTHLPRAWIIVGMALCFGLGAASLASAEVPLAIVYGEAASTVVYNDGMLNGAGNTPLIINYGIETVPQSQTTTVAGASATANANVSADLLSLTLDGTNGYDEGIAETWDTLNFGNLPTGGSVTGGTVLGDLTLTVTTSAFSSLSAAYGLQVYKTGSFVPTTTGEDCGLAATPCGGFLASSTNHGVIQAMGLVQGSATAGTVKYTVPLTDSMLMFGALSFIAEIGAENTTTSTVTIDPSVSLSDLYSGITVESATGTNYNPPVPLPASAWLFLSGMGGVGLIARREL